jgi:5-methylcytosine-specific restriction endonuclease McrA
VGHTGEGELLEQAVTEPSAEAQLQFLTKLQRLFNEGDFVATYKYATLMALAELAVELGQDDENALDLTHGQIAQKLIELYWQQAAPYSSGRSGSTSEVLIQNAGVQAAVVVAIEQFRLQHSGITLQTARSLPSYKELLNTVSTTASAQPLKYLQNMGGHTDTFLYERQRGSIRLLPGVMYCLRRFQPLVNQLSRQHWVAHIKRNRRNHTVLGEADDLESFLFETSRQSLGVVSRGLRKLVNGRCFYCRNVLQEADVDHFVPFALYPRDLMQNFVLAHPSCNRSKSNTLAAKEHLDRWMGYAYDHKDHLLEIGREAGVASDPEASRAVVHWSYTCAAQQGAQAWRRPGQYETVTMDYLGAL